MQNRMWRLRRLTKPFILILLIKETLKLGIDLLIKSHVNRNSKLLFMFVCHRFVGVMHNHVFLTCLISLS